MRIEATTLEELQDELWDTYRWLVITPSALLQLLDDREQATCAG